MITASSGYRIIFVHPESASWIIRNFSQYLSRSSGPSIFKVRSKWLCVDFFCEGVTWRLCYVVSYPVLVRYFGQYNWFFSDPGNLGLWQLPKSATLPVGIVLVIAVSCLVDRWTHLKRSVNAAVTSCELHFLPQCLPQNVFSLSAFLFAFHWFEYLNWVHLPKT